MVRNLLTAGLGARGNTVLPTFGVNSTPLRVFKFVSGRDAYKYSSISRVVRWWCEKEFTLMPVKRAGSSEVDEVVRTRTKAFRCCVSRYVCEGEDGSEEDDT